MPQNPKENFIELLKELFQLNNTDLDFGIYRILKLRSRDVEEFINKVLPEKLEEVKKKLADRASADVKRDLETVTTELKTSYGDDFDNKVDQFGQIELFKEKYGSYSLLKEKLDNARISEELETDVYNELYRFFERYYEEGDFVTKPRAGDKTYMIPYDGEEVKLYWANYDQYYIKTGENFKNYIFTNGEEGENKVTVEFRIKDVETSVNNNQNQKGRLFIPTEDFYEWNEANKKLITYFYYKVPTEEEKQNWGSKQSVKTDNKGVNEQLIIALEGKIKQTNNPQLILFFNKEREVNNKKQKVFYYHLNRYTSLNKFDYFIHKDLKKFLTRELDYFLKNEILSINFLDPNWREEDVQEAIKLNVVKAGVIREAAYTIINFLSELENFQRRLFEKKKFVVQSEYVMTMDIIPEEVYDEVVEAIINDTEKRQLNECVDLGFIENAEITKEEIVINKGLVIDTKFFEDELKFKLLNYIEGIDKKSNGLLINSENWQGLNNFIGKYYKKIKTIYLDPPYNTSSSEIIYKNSYKHSTWITFVENRLRKSNYLTKEDGIICITIDHIELHRLRALIEEIYTDENILGLISIKNNPSGRSTVQGVSISNEFAVIIGKTINAKIGNLERTELQEAQYPEIDELGKYQWRSFLRAGGANDFRTARPKLYYPLYASKNKIRIPIMEWDAMDRNWLVKDNPNEDEEIIYPQSNGVEYSWRLGVDTLTKKMNEVRVRINRNNNYAIDIKFRLDEQGVLPKTIWENKLYNATSYGTSLLKNILGQSQLFSFPKSVYAVKDCLKVSNAGENEIVLDYFAGSGTTGHAIIKLNKEDNGNRKFILMEMGEYFESVLLKRLKKIMYAAEWKEGKPKDRGKLDGYSTILQYQKLEQYEDCLNNIVFDEQEIELEFEDRIKYRFREGAENSASIMLVDRFADPFNYKMEILQQNERKLQTVDLVTTFNFLLGIDLNKIKTEEHNGRTYRIITGTKRQQNYFVVWRKFDEALRLDEERDWIKALTYYDENAKMYCNADNGFGAESTEAEFKRLMFEDVK